jgi:ribosome recycling factor
MAAQFHLKKFLQSQHLMRKPLWFNRGIKASCATSRKASRRQILRVPVPELTGERRQELAKTAGKIAEDGRVSIRQARRDALDLLKAAKNESLSEDDFKRYEKEVQKLHDDRIAEINQLLSSKEKELQTV